MERVSYERSLGDASERWEYEVDEEIGVDAIAKLLEMLNAAFWDTIWTQRWEMGKHRHTGETVERPTENA